MIVHQYFINVFFVCVLPIKSLKNCRGAEWSFTTESNDSNVKFIHLMIITWWQICRGEVCLCCTSPCCCALRFVFPHFLFLIGYCPVCIFFGTFPTESRSCTTLKSFGGKYSLRSCVVLAKILFFFKWLNAFRLLLWRTKVHFKQ